MSAPTLIAENMEAIDRYIAYTPKQTKKATEIADEWRAFYDDLSWFGKRSQDNYDKARNMRNEFNRANAVTVEQKTAVEQQIKTGTTSEEAVGEVKRTTSTGDYIESGNAVDYFIPLQTKILIGVLGFVGFIAWLGTNHPIFKIPKKVLGISGKS